MAETKPIDPYGDEEFEALAAGFEQPTAPKAVATPAKASK